MKRAWSFIFFIFFLSIAVNSYCGEQVRQPPFDIDIMRFIKPPFDITIPDDAITSIDDELEKKLTKIFVLLDINSLQAIAKDFAIIVPPNISKRNLIRILARNLKITDLRAREALNEPRSRREITLNRFRENRQKGVIIHNADEVISLEQRQNRGLTKIFIFGHVEIEYQQRKFRGELMVINVKDRKAQEIMGLGNVTIQSQSMFMIADKFFYYPSTRQGVFYNPKTYFKPFFIKSPKLKIINNDTMILDNMVASTCDLEHAHFHITASRTFIYGRDKYVFVNVVYNVGQTPFFYSPIYVHSLYGSGIKTALGYQRGMNWFIQNTYYLNLRPDTKFVFKFDYYEMLGIYAGIDITIPYTTIKLGGAYDRHVKQIDLTTFTNYFEEVAGQGPVSGRSLRGKIDISFSHDIMKFFDPNMPFSLNTRFYYKDATDPYFTTQFEGKRSEVTDYLKILKADISPASYAPTKAAYEQAGRSLGYDMTFNFKRTSFNFAGDWNYRMARTNDPQYAENPYLTEFWSNYKQTISFPRLALNTNIDLFDFFYIIGVTKVATGTTPAGTASEENTLRNIKDGWKYSWPFTATPGIRYTRIKSYSLTNGEARLESDIITKTLSVAINAPMGIEYNYKEIGIKWELPFSATYNANEQVTNNPNSSQVESDLQNTSNSYNFNTGAAFTFEFLKNYEYINGKLRFSMNYSQSSKFGKNIVNSTDYQRNETINFDAEFEWLKTSVKVTFGHNYSPSIENRRGTLAVTTSTKIIPYITFSDTYSYDRDLKLSLNNNMSVTLTGLENVRLIKTFFLKKFTFTLTWYKSFLDFKNNYMSWNYTMDFGIADHTTFALSVRGQNKKLVAYTDHATEAGVKGGQQNFFTDLLRSFNFFNSDDRRQSFFKLTGITLDVVHMLHKWKLQFTFKFESTLQANGSIAFLPSIFFAVTLADLPGFGPPPIQNRYSEQGVSSYGR